MQKKNWKKLVGIASAAMLAATQTIPAVAVSAAEDTADYVYCYAALTWAEYWQNEGVYLDDAADGDLGASSTEKDTHGEYDLGAYDAVTRATSNHGLHRGSYQCTVKVYDTDGNAYDYTGKGQDESVDVVKNDNGGADITVNGEVAGTYDHSVNVGPKYVPVAVPADEYEAFKEAYTVYENGDTITGGYTEKNLVNINETVSVDANTPGLKTAEKEADGTFQFSKRSTSETPEGKTVNPDAVEISSVQHNSGYGDFIRVDIEGDYGDLGAHMYAVRWDYYGDGDTVLATYGTKFAADNWMHKSMGIQLGLTQSDRCQLPEGTDGYGRWDVTVYATGYQDFTFTVNNDYVFGTVNLPYADYYYGELNSVSENPDMDLEAEDKTAALRAEGCYDAVTSATNTKSKKYGATYYTENEDGSVTVEGIRDVAIAVPRKLYEDATAAIADGKTCNNQLLNIIGNMTVSESQDAPAEYKFLNGDGTLSAMVDSNKAVTVSDAEVKVKTNTRYGNYQLDITEADADNSLLPSADDMEGAIVTMTDGTKYAMLHVDNLWLKTGKMAWAATENFVTHGNTLKYKNFEDTAGKTVASVRYIVRSGSDVTYTATDAYLPLLHDGTAAVEATPVAEGKIALTLTDLPEDYAATASISGLESTYANGVLTYDAAAAKPGSYTITVSDTNGVYAPISVSVILTTDDLPAAFDADTKTIVAVKGADADALANYLSKMSKATIDGVSYNLSGKGATKLFDTKTGAMDTAAKSRDGLVFTKAGTYEITISATGYTTDLTFEVTLKDSDIAVVLPTVKGDADMDGEITMDDAFAVLQYYSKHAAGNDSYQFTDNAEAEAELLKLVDIDGDGSITLDDAFYILSYYSYHAAGRDAAWEDVYKPAN